MKFTKSAPLWGEITVPGDKSISHRAVMLGSLAEGTTEVTNFLKGADCISTIRAFQAMGIDIEEKEDTLLIHGKGLHGLQAPKETWIWETAEPLRDSSPVFSQGRLLRPPSPATILLRNAP